jgi:hypothetical protein
MSLATNVQEQIRRFVVGVVSADDLSDWLDAHAQRIHDAGDSETRRLTDLAFNLLEDIVQGNRTTEEVQARLSTKVPMTVILSEPGVRETGASAVTVTVSFTTVHVPDEVASRARSYGGALTEPFPAPAQAF